MTNYQKSLLILSLILIVLQGIIVSVIGLNRNPWGDEGHFVETINEFGKNPFFIQITNYKEVTPPLVFVIYAFWGKIFGFEIYILRILSLVIAYLTYLLFHKLLYDFFNNSKIAILVTLFFAINPYMMGFSIFVYTDMLAILFLLLCCIAIYHSNSTLLAISGALTLLCRQYMVFVLVAAFIFFLLKYFLRKNRVLLEMILTSTIALIPIVILFIIWKGFAPRLGRELWIIRNVSVFNLNSITLYICLIPVYLFPIVILRWNYFYSDRKLMITSFFASFLYWLFPVMPSRVTVEQMGIHTVGLFHKLMFRILGFRLWDQIPFFVLFFFGLPVILFIIRDIYRKLKFKEIDYLFFLNLSVLSFLFLMQLSYQVWEKYFLPIIPILAIRILMIKKGINNNSTQLGKASIKHF